MGKVLGKILEKPFFSASAYVIFRVLAALLFLQFGLQKIFGMFGGINGQGQKVMDMYSLVWAAGVIELVVGIMVALGVFTRFFALIGTIEMAAAYVIGHASNGFFPIQNGGVVALLFFLVFLIITIGGAGRLSLERGIWGKELF